MGEFSDPCSMCRSHDAKWLAVDDMMHTTWVVYLTDDLKLDMKPRSERVCYVVCERCRRQVEGWNRRSRKPRGLKFLPWS
jgi:hypothetical protein